MISLSMIVADSSPLINAAVVPEVGHKVLRRLFTRIYIPRPVHDEVSVRLPNKDYALTYGLVDLFTIIDRIDVPDIIASRFKPREAEKYALAFALDRSIPLLAEERKVRRVADALNIEVIGFIGLLVIAHRKAIVTTDEATFVASELKKHGHINAAVLDGFTRSLQP